MPTTLVNAVFILVTVDDQDSRFLKPFRTIIKQQIDIAVLKSATIIKIADKAYTVEKYALSIDGSNGPATMAVYVSHGTAGFVISGVESFALA